MLFFSFLQMLKRFSETFRVSACQLRTRRGDAHWWIKLLRWKKKWRNNSSRTLWTAAGPRGQCEKVAPPGYLKTVYTRMRHTCTRLAAMWVSGDHTPVHLKLNEENYVPICARAPSHARRFASLCHIRGKRHLRKSPKMRNLRSTLMTSLRMINGVRHDILRCYGFSSSKNERTLLVAGELVT